MMKNLNLNDRLEQLDELDAKELDNVLGGTYLKPERLLKGYGSGHGYITVEKQTNETSVYSIRDSHGTSRGLVLYQNDGTVLIPDLTFFNN